MMGQLCVAMLRAVKFHKGVIFGSFLSQVSKKG